ncbi:MAG: hypothetical protein QM767_30335 [Anaeromyxobacter sp.]
MTPGNESPPRGFSKLEALLEFRPWMLALAVFLACAIGVALMERFRDAPPTLYAQATPPAQTHR